MRYLVIINNEVFYTEWFDEENFFSEGMIIIDLATDQYMRMPGKWRSITEDHL